MKILFILLKMKQAMPEIIIETQTKHDYNVYQIETLS